METHVKVIAWLHIVFSALGLLIGGLVLLGSLFAGVISGNSEDIFLFGTFGIIISCFIVVVSVPGLAGGIGLLKWQPWARIVMLVLAILNLFNFPFGTALGGYVMWVLLQEETSHLFDDGGPAYTSFSDFE